ncbi:ATP-binding protein [Mobilicoccus caccae]|uniref:Sensor-like histidine kinase SenX3 n=1 Tax=Mobilicoccus caccae TaxID=1859295 RepID=A0ABQ6IM78_9MICO|nr:ATP-binding protein [Mobilicoccus caccae]GMA39012.1 hypothetical protein GCM10025883_10570 [Mobilicoccus caccae]
MDGESGWTHVRRACLRVLGPHTPALTRHTAYAVLFGVSVIVGRMTVAPETGLALVWPAAGVAFVWFLTTAAAGGTLRANGSSLVTVAILVITTPLNIASGLAPSYAFVFALGNAAAGFFAAWAYRLARPRGAFDLTRLRHVPALLGASLAAGFGSALWGPLYSVVVTGADPELLWHSIARNGIGTLIFGAVSLRLLSPAPTVRSAGPVWLVALAVSGVAGYWWAFIAAPHLPITFLLTCLTVFAALVLHADGFMAYVLVTGGFILSASVAEIGPYALADASGGVFIAQAFVGAQAVIGLLLCLGREDQERLIRDVRRSRREAERQSELIGRVVAGMSEAVVAVDGRRVIVGNGAAEELLGITTGMSIDGTVLAAGGTQGELPLDRALRGRSDAQDILLDGGGGSRPRVLSVRAHPLAGHPGFALAVARDVTDHRRQVSELSSFASVVAHDLLNPIGAVEGWLEIVEDETDAQTPGIIVSSLRRAQGSTRRLREIVTGLHGYSVARGGELSPVELGLQALGERLAAGRVEAAAMNGGGVVPDIRVDADQAVLADEALIAQVLDNLLGNSIKYTAPGRIAHITLTATPPVEGFVTVRVDDDGIGIPEGEREKVFEEFHRVEGHAGAYVGTGLGLSICRRMVERHGGRIRALASPLGGTRMEFTLPAAATPEALDDDRATRRPESADGQTRAAGEQARAAQEAVRSTAPRGSEQRSTATAADAVGARSRFGR